MNAVNSELGPRLLVIPRDRGMAVHSLQLQSVAGETGKVHGRVWDDERQSLPGVMKAPVRRISFNERLLPTESEEGLCLENKVCC